MSRSATPFQLLGHQPQMRLRAASPVRRRRAASISLRRATVISHASGLSGTPSLGQSAKRRGEGIGQRILGRRDVAGAGGEEGDELAVASPRDRLGGRAPA